MRMQRANCVLGRNTIRAVAVDTRVIRDSIACISMSLRAEKTFAVAIEMRRAKSNKNRNVYIFCSVNFLCLSFSLSVNSLRQNLACKFLDQTSCERVCDPEKSSTNERQFYAENRLFASRGNTVEMSELVYRNLRRASVRGTFIR